MRLCKHSRSLGVGVKKPLLVTEPRDNEVTLKKKRRETTSHQHSAHYPKCLPLTESAFHEQETGGGGGRGAATHSPRRASSRSPRGQAGFSRTAPAPKQHQGQDLRVTTAFPPAPTAPQQGPKAVAAADCCLHSLLLPPQSLPHPAGPGQVRRTGSCRGGLIPATGRELHGLGWVHGTAREGGSEADPREPLPAPQPRQGMPANTALAL